MSILRRLFSKKREREFRQEFGETTPPRLHPYRFAHYALRETVFEDPSAFFAEVRSAEGEAWLGLLWRQVGSRTAIRENAPRVSPDGLALAWGEVDGMPYPIVVMPPPEGFAEAYFVAVVPPPTPEDEARYLLLEREERATAERPMGLLCEWFADGRRTNHSWLMTADRELFEEAVATTLRDEARRREAGIRPVGMPRWRSDEDPEMKEDERPAHFRPQHALFAYHVAPRAAARLVETTDPRPLLLELWAEAGRLAAQAGFPSDVPPKGLDARFVPVGDAPHLLILLPEPLGAPEAYAVLLSVDEAPPTVHTLERPCYRRDRETIVGRIDPGGHAVRTWSEDATVEAFLDTVEHLRKGMSRPEPPYDLLGQLLLYRPVFEIVRKVDPEPEDEEGPPRSS